MKSMILRYRSFKILCDGQTDEIVTISEADFIDSIFNGLEIKSLHSPDFFKFVVNHNCIGIALNS